jgi:hypothetical protein
MATAVHAVGDAITAWLTAPVPALPVDVFRALAGAVSFCYFARTLMEVPDFSSPDGVLDHPLLRRIFPPTRLSLFQLGAPAALFRLVFAASCAASVALALGYWVRASAALLFVVAVSTYRWNFIVMYVDDAIMHLTLFWLVVMPVGHTLTLGDWLRDGGAALASWTAVTVPGGTVRCFLANLALAYFVAGAYKWTSPMWRDGSALQAILMMPISRAPARWRPHHRVPLRLASFGALAAEPLFPLLFVLPAGSAAKWLALASVVGFHVGIVATLRIPFANAAMLGAIPIALSPEIMRWFGAPPRAAVQAPVASGVGLGEVLGLVVVGSLTMMVLLEVWNNGWGSRPPLWKTNTSRFRRDPFCAVLWGLGIAQSYRLFDWVDRRNFHIRYRVFESVPNAPAREIDADELFPRGIRHLILQSYVHGSIWLQIHDAGLRELRRAILGRYARRYARGRGAPSGTIEAFAVLQRITADNLDLRRGSVPRLLLRFTCERGDAVVEFAALEPALPGAASDRIPSLGRPRTGAAAPA